MNTTSRNPDSVSRVNITPAAPRSLRTMCCTPDRQRDRGMVEAVVHAVGDGAVVEQRGVHFVHAVEQVLARRAR